MICKLRGKIDEIFVGSVSIDVGGICYLVYTPSNTLVGKNIGDDVCLEILHLFRQEQQVLCGFIDKAQLSMFKLLLDVQGVGIKSAISILANINVGDLVAAIMNKDDAVLCVADGIGKKTAQRIVNELCGKDMSHISVGSQSGNVNVGDAVLALVQLGYSRDHSYRVAMSVVEKHGGSSLDTNTIVVECLQVLNG